MSKGSEFDLEERLMDFVVRIIKLTETSPLDIPVRYSAVHFRSERSVNGYGIRLGPIPNLQV